MKVQSKVFFALVLLIVLMGASFFGFSYLYTKQMLQNYATTIKKNNAAQWADQLAFFYQENGMSWMGVERYIHLIVSQDKERLGWVQRLILLDENKQPIIDIGRETNEAEITMTFPILIDHSQVATLQIKGHNPNQFDQLSKTFFQSMTLGVFFGIIFTSLIALLVGIWFIRFITKPLQTMIQTMNRIKQGDLQARLSIETNDEFGEVGNTFNLMTEQLFRTEQARSHLVADVAHELRTPLMIIQGQLELIQQGIKQPSPSTLLPIQDEVSRLSDLVQDLHQLSLAEVGQLSLEKQPTDLKQLIRQLLDMFQPESQSRHIKLRFMDQTHSSSIQLAIDPARIKQVLVNLLSNALRYTPMQGEISLQLTEEPTQFIIKLTDTGKGIAAEHLPYLFDRFYRAEEDRSRDQGGTGLGLAIAKEFVEAHGGKISVQSQLNHGTTFLIQLPRDESSK